MLDVKSCRYVLQKEVWKCWSDERNVVLTGTEIDIQKLLFSNILFIEIKLKVVHWSKSHGMRYRYCIVLLPFCYFACLIIIRVTENGPAFLFWSDEPCRKLKYRNRPSETQRAWFKKVKSAECISTGVRCKIIIIKN